MNPPSAHRGRGKRGRGAFGKTAVFGLFKRHDQMYTEIVPDCQKATLQAIIRRWVSMDSVRYSDGWRGYDGTWWMWGTAGTFKVDHGRDEFVRGGVPIIRHRGLLGLREKPLGEVPRHEPANLLPAPQRM